MQETKDIAGARENDNPEPLAGLKEYAKRRLPLLLGACAGANLFCLVAGAWGGSWGIVGLAGDFANHFIGFTLVVYFLYELVSQGIKFGLKMGFCAFALAVYALAVTAGSVESARGVSGPPSESSLMVASLNVHTDNQDMQEVAAWVLKHRPDVMAFEETNTLQRAALDKALASEYPHSRHSMTDGLFGLSIYSKEPLRSAEFLYDSGIDQPMFHGQVEHQGLLIDIGVVHPMPPFTGEYLEKRDARVLELAQRLKGRRSILMGDFNATMHSTLFHKFEKGQFERYTPGSFATVYPYLLKVDHILFATGYFDAEDKGTANIKGSDHDLVWNRLAPKN